MQFFKSNKKTVLVVKATEVMRAEVSFRGGRMVVDQLERTERHPDVPMVTAAEMAVGLIGSNPSMNTILMVEDIWSGILDIDDRSIFGLEGAELEQMLKFETETMSSLDPMNSFLGAVELASVPPDTRRFWCSALPNEMLKQACAMVRLRGGKLTQISSTIGLAGPNGQSAWTEFSDSLAGAFIANSDGLPRASITRRSKQSDRWFRSLNSLFGGDLPSTGWLEAGAERPSVYSGTLVEFEADELVSGWVADATDRLNPKSHPVVLPPAPGTSVKTYRTVSFAASVMMLLLCFLGYWNANAQEAAIKLEIEQLQKPADEKASMVAISKSLKSQNEKLFETYVEISGQQDAVVMLTSGRDRYSVLLRLLAQNRHPLLTVRSLELDPDGLVITGESVRNDAPNQLALAIASQLLPFGWKVSTPTITGSNQMTDRGPWKFSLKLIEVAPEDESSKSLTSGKISQNLYGVKR